MITIPHAAGHVKTYMSRWRSKGRDCLSANFFAARFNCSLRTAITILRAAGMKPGYCRTVKGYVWSPGYGHYLYNTYGTPIKDISEQNKLILSQLEEPTTLWGRSQSHRILDGDIIEMRVPTSKKGETNATCVHCHRRSIKWE